MQNKRPRLWENRNILFFVSWLLGIKTDIIGFNFNRLDDVFNMPYLKMVHSPIILSILFFILIKMILDTLYSSFFAHDVENIDIIIVETALLAYV
jgi:hypothetical protein